MFLLQITFNIISLKQHKKAIQKNKIHDIFTYKMYFAQSKKEVKETSYYRVTYVLVTTSRREQPINNKHSVVVHA